jgi:hypothetical protein
MGVYIAHHHTIPLLRARIGAKIRTQGLDYGEHIERNGVRISLHPSGHVAGAAQVRIDNGREVWVVSGDYKLEPDGGKTRLSCLMTSIAGGATTAAVVSRVFSIVIHWGKHNAFSVILIRLSDRSWRANRLYEQRTSLPTSASPCLGLTLLWNNRTRISAVRSFFSHRPVLPLRLSGDSPRFMAPSYPGGWQPQRDAKETASGSFFRTMPIGMA